MGTRLLQQILCNKVYKPYVADLMQKLIKSKENEIRMRGERKAPQKMFI